MNRSPFLNNSHRTARTVVLGTLAAATLVAGGISARSAFADGQQGLVAPSETRISVDKASYAIGDPITVSYEPGTVEIVEQHDGTRLVLKKVAADYDPTDRLGAMAFLQKHSAMGQVVTGLLFVDREPEDLHQHFNTVDAPLNSLSEKELCPGQAALDKINAALR